VSRCIPTDAQAITLGVDTHKDLHVALALDGIGRHLGAPSACRRTWQATKGSCTGQSSSAPSRARRSRRHGILRSRSESLVEGPTDKGLRGDPPQASRPIPRWQLRSHRDAEAAARAVVAGTATGQPKSADGEVEMIRTLRITRRSALKARVGAANQLQNLLLITAPEGLKS
jgi:transposase